MKKLILLACIIANYCSAQTQISWEKHFGSYTNTSNGWEIIELPDSTYTVLARINNLYKLLHLNYFGDTLWTKSYMFNCGYRLLYTSDGGYAFVGNATSNSNIVLVKTNNLGDTLWTNSYPNSANCYGFIQAHDSGFIISSNDGSKNITKTDSNGVVIFRIGLPINTKMKY